MNSVIEKIGAGRILSMLFSVCTAAIVSLILAMITWLDLQSYYASSMDITLAEIERALTSGEKGFEQRLASYISKQSQAYKGKSDVLENARLFARCGEKTRQLQIKSKEDGRRNGLAFDFRMSTKNSPSLNGHKSTSLRKVFRTPKSCAQRAAWFVIILFWFAFGRNVCKKAYQKRGGSNNCFSLSARIKTGFYSVMLMFIFLAAGFSGIAYIIISTEMQQYHGVAMNTMLNAISESLQNRDCELTDRLRDFRRTQRLSYECRHNLARHIAEFACGARGTRVSGDTPLYDDKAKKDATP